MQDAGEAVGELAQGGLVADVAGALLVVVGARSRGCLQRAERLAGHCVQEPVVVYVPGHHQTLLAGLAGDGGGPGVVLAGSGVGVPVWVVAELGQLTCLILSGVGTQ